MHSTSIQHGGGKLHHVKQRKEKPSYDKITLIFALDETLVTKVSSYIYSSIHTTFGPLKLITINYKTADKYARDTTEILAIRPGFMQFKEFLLNNLKYFNIGFWSLGMHTRLKAIIAVLFPQLMERKIISVLIGSKSKIYYTVNEKYDQVVYTKWHQYDILKHKHIKIDSILNGSITKRVDLLCDSPDYRNILNKNRTILIDDLPNNIIVNDSHNAVWVNKWRYNFTCDDTLSKLQKWLDKHKHRKSFVNVKMPNYARDSKFNEIITPTASGLAVESQMICNDRHKKNESSSKHKKHSVSKHVTNTHYDKTKKTKKANLSTHRQITHKLKKKLSSKTKKMTAK
jgi:hypothetical protein